MKKPNDFAYTLSKFLTDYLAGLRNLSPHTIYSYRDAFKLFLKFCGEKEGLPAEKITFADVDVSLIERFLQWLQKERNASVSTRNQRLAALHAFFRYVQYEHPEQAALCQRIFIYEICESASK